MNLNPNFAGKHIVRSHQPQLQRIPVKELVCHNASRAQQVIEQTAPPDRADGESLSHLSAEIKCRHDHSRKFSGYGSFRRSPPPSNIH